MITLNALITAVGLTSLVIATRIRRCTPEAIFGFAQEYSRREFGLKLSFRFD